MHKDVQFGEKAVIEMRLMKCNKNSCVPQFVGDENNNEVFIFIHQ